MRKFKHYFFYTEKNGTQKAEFKPGYFNFLGIPYDAEGLTVEQALYMVNRWNTVGKTYSGYKEYRYWIDLEEL